MDIFWQIVSSIFGMLGGLGDKMIGYVERPILKVNPFTDKREWKYDGVISSEKPTYYGSTVSPGFIQIPGKSKSPRYFVHLSIKNDTKHRGKNSTAKKLFAKLTFYDVSFQKKLLSDIYGRWAESIEPPLVLYKDSLKYIDILPGDQKTLDLASRYYSHLDWYAVSTESYTADQFENSSNLIRESFLDSLESFGVEVELSGENIKHSMRFQIHNRGNFGEPRIEKVVE